MLKSKLKFLLLYLLVFLMLPLGQGFVSSPKKLLEIEEITLQQINKYREKKGLIQFTNVPYLQELAREHSMKIANGVRSFGHKGWDERADMIFENLEAEFVAENVGYNKGYDDPAVRVVEGWLGSKEHKENLMNEEFTGTGIGVAESQDGTFYFTQLFVSYMK